MTIDIAPITPNAGLEKFKESAKAYAGLVGALVTSLAVVVVDGPAAYVLALLGAAATGIGVWTTSNAESAEDRDKREALEDAASANALPDDPYGETGYAQTVHDGEPEREIVVSRTGETEVIDARDLS